MVFAFNNQKADIDPQVQQLVRKVVLLRRVTAKYPTLLTTAKAAICAYEQQGKGGTTTTYTMDQPNQPHTGPIGHLLSALHSIGIRLDANFNLTHNPYNQHNTKPQHKQTITNIMHIPWQHLPGQIEHLAQEHRFSNEAKVRSRLQPATTIDQTTYKASLRLQPPSHHNILQQLATGAG